jgi:hypothetical protein
MFVLLASENIRESIPDFAGPSRAAQCAQLDRPPSIPDMYPIKLFAAS